jgi:hypothetical protein
MNEQSILKRTLILTGKLVGVFSIWVALASFAATLAASHLVAAMSGPAAAPATLAPADGAKKDDGTGARAKTPPANVTNKPNG